MRVGLFAALIVAVLAAGAGIYGALYYFQAGGTNNAPGLGVPELGGPFSLIDQTGAARTQQDFAGAPMLIYFGYSYCPDVCPTELAKMIRAIDLLGDEGEKIQPVFITVDPERDTPENLAGYVGLFHPRLVGLTGSQQAIAEVAHEYKVYYAKVESEEYADYLMDHSSYFYLLDANGKNAGVFPSTFTAEDIAGQVRRLLSNRGVMG